MAQGQVYEGYYPNSNSASGAGLGSGISMLLGGLFGDSSRPYEKSMDQYRSYMDQARGAQNPFYNAGTKATGNYENWLGGMQDPSSFIAQLMNQYQTSPYAKNLMQQSNRAGINAASAGGLIGSTPFAQQLQQNSGQISSQDMNQWLQNVLGINNQYGQGQQNLMNAGTHSGDILSNLYGQAAPWLANDEFNRQTARQNDKWNALGGAAQTGASLAQMFA